MKTIGRIVFGKFETEIKATPKVIKYLDNEDMSLATLIPNVYQFYEQILFDHIDKDGDGKPDREFGEKFELICHGITESEEWDDDLGLKIEGFKEEIKNSKELLVESKEVIESAPRNPNKKFAINWSVFQK